jgi:hypothetical protein
MQDNIMLQSFFSININSNNIHHHPFVINRIIPALEKAHPKSIAALKQKVKKKLTTNGCSSDKIADLLWGQVLTEAISLTIKKLGEDRNLSFGLMTTSDGQTLVWDRLFKSLYSCDSFSFSIPLLRSNYVDYFGDEDGAVYLRGSHSTANRNGQSYSVIRIYFYIHDVKEHREPGEKKISENVGLLCELPYFFVRSDRYETFSDSEVTNKLLDLFELKKPDNDLFLDFIPTNELGDMTSGRQWVEIGNDFVTFNIN